MTLDTGVKLAGVERVTMIALAIAGAITAVVGGAMAPERLWASGLLVGYYIVGVGLAGLCFVAIHYTAGATWSRCSARGRNPGGDVAIGSRASRGGFRRAPATLPMDERRQSRFARGYRTGVQTLLAFAPLLS